MENNQIDQCFELANRERNRGHHIVDRAMLYELIINHIVNQGNGQCHLTNQELSESIGFLSISRIAVFINELVADGWLKHEITAAGDRVLSLVPVGRA